MPIAGVRIVACRPPLHVAASLRDAESGLGETGPRGGGTPKLAWVCQDPVGRGRDGKAFHILVNYEPEGTEVALGNLKTKDRFATDYKD